MVKNVFPGKKHPYHQCGHFGIKEQKALKAPLYCGEAVELRGDCGLPSKYQGNQAKEPEVEKCEHICQDR